jgi:hypothetical protein
LERSLGVLEVATITRIRKASRFVIDDKGFKRTVNQASGEIKLKPSLRYIKGRISACTSYLSMVNLSLIVIPLPDCAHGVQEHRLIVFRHKEKSVAQEWGPTALWLDLVVNYVDNRPYRE